MTYAKVKLDAVVQTIAAAIRKQERARPWRREAAVDEVTQAAKTAINAFAAINGWRTTPAFFDLGRINRSLPPRHDDRSLDRELLDHCIGFSTAHGAVAVAGQPYGSEIDLAEHRAGLAERGLALHVPPDPLASIHYPGWTLFVVITREGGSVKWLPEQDGRLRMKWKSPSRGGSGGEPDGMSTP